MPRSTDCSTKQAQQRYKAHFNHSVRRQLQLQVNDFFYIDRPPFTMRAADRLRTETYSNLLSRTSGLFQITAMGQHTSTLDEDRVPNTVFIERATREPNPGHPPPRASSNQKSKHDTVKDANNPTGQPVNGHQPGNTTLRKESHSQKISQIDKNMS